MTITDIKTLSPEQLLELHQVELEREYAKGERKGILHGLGWDGLTDEEVTWVCKRLKERGKFIFQPTVGQIREMIANEKLIIKFDDDNKDDIGDFDTKE